MLFLERKSFNRKPLVGQVFRLRFCLRNWKTAGFEVEVFWTKQFPQKLRKLLIYFHSIQFHVKEIPIQSNLYLNYFLTLFYLLTSILILMAATSRSSEKKWLNEQTIYIIWSLQLGWPPFYVQAHWCVGTIILSTAVQWTEAVGFYNTARLNFSGVSVNLDRSCSQTTP